MSKIISFYKEEEHDVKDRSLSDLLQFDKDDLEVVHDYIQWLFPLREASNFNPNAPLVDDKDVAAFKKDRLLQRNLQRSYKTMLSFYGFEKDAETKDVSKTADFDEAASNWLTPGNHNFLRMSRILGSLTLLGMEEDAQKFFTALDNVYQDNSDVIGEKTFSFWKKAIEVSNTSAPSGKPLFQPN